MGIGHPPRNRKDRRGNNNVVSLRHPDDDFFEVLSPLLEEAAVAKSDQSPRQGLPNVVSLAKENARLRALAVGLSNSARRLARSPVAGCRPMRSQQGVTTARSLIPRKSRRARDRCEPFHRMIGVDFSSGL